MPRLVRIGAPAIWNKRGDAPQSGGTIHVICSDRLSVLESAPLALQDLVDQAACPNESLEDKPLTLAARAAKTRGR